MYQFSEYGSNPKYQFLNGINAYANIFRFADKHAKYYFATIACLHFVTQLKMFTPVWKAKYRVDTWFGKMIKTL